MRKILIFVFLIFILIGSSWAQQWDGHQLMRVNTHIHTSYSKESWLKMHSLGHQIYTKGAVLDHMTAKNPQETLKKCKELGIHPIFTDHCFKLTEKEFEDTLNLVKNSTYISLMGFELTWLKDNHMNIINTTKLVTTNEENEFDNVQVLHNLDEFNNWLKNTTDDIIVQLNHPLYTENNYANYSALELNDKICLMELNTNVPFVKNIYYNLPLYFLAIQRGLKVAPTIGHDNFGSPNENTRKNHTGVWVKSNTHEGLFEGLKAKRVYATEIKDMILTFSAKVKTSNDWHKMGETISSASDCFETYIHLSSSKPLGLVSIIELKKQDKYQILILKQIDKNAVNLREIIYPTKEAICLMVLVKDKYGDMTVSAPIWINVEQSTITHVNNIPNNPSEEKPSPQPIGYRLAKTFQFNSNIRNIFYDDINKNVLIHSGISNYTIYDQNDNLITDIYPNSDGTITDRMIYPNKDPDKQDCYKYYDFQNNILAITYDNGYYYLVSSGPENCLKKNGRASKIDILTKFYFYGDKIIIADRKEIFKKEKTGFVIDTGLRMEKMLIMDNLLYFIDSDISDYYIILYNISSNKIIKEIKIEKKFSENNIKIKNNYIYLQNINNINNINKIIRYDKYLNNPQIVLEYIANYRNFPYDQMISNFYIDQNNDLYLRYVHGDWDKFVYNNGEYRHVYRGKIDSPNYRNNIIVTNDQIVYVNDCSKKEKIYKYVPIYK